MSKECNECTKCCEGWLIAEINMNPVYPGKPCFLVQVGKGCSDYGSRPHTPCRTYECSWKIDEKIPDEFKPSKIGVIINHGFFQNIPFFTLVNAPNSPDKKFLKWMKEYADSMDMGIRWTDEDGNIQLYGPKVFIEGVSAFTPPKMK